MKSQKGASLIEFSLLVLLIAVLGAVGIQSFGPVLINSFDNDTRQIEAAGGNINGDCNEANPNFPDCQ